jgi:aspartyl-tRNA(Asn)/glutamyl-tRNA(Gln) amidotransferase subunit B
MFEIHRQTALLAHGEAVTQVTLLWDPDHQVARVMRGKEDSEDYRYFPDPDLSELHLEALGLEDPESGRFAPPWETFRHLQEEEGLTADDALFVLQHPEFRALFTAVRAEMPPLFPPNHTLNFIRTDLTGLLRGAPLLVQKKATRKSPCPPPSEIAALSQWVGEERISGKMAKIALKHLVDHPGITAQAALDAEGLSRVCGDTEVEVHIQGILRDFPEVIQQIREGREKAFGFLMGQLMTRSNGTLPPQKAQAALKRTISQATEIPEGR